MEPAILDAKGRHLNSRTFSVTDSTAKQLLDRKQIHDNTWSTVTLVTQTDP